MDQNRYRYAYHKSTWQVAGKSEVLDLNYKFMNLNFSIFPNFKSRVEAKSSELFFHPDGPFKGCHFDRHILSFEKLKLTNSFSTEPGKI